MCQVCERGAVGRHGHPVLHEKFRSGFGPDGEPAYVLYHCALCGCVWNRHRAADGGYSWTLKSSCTDAP